MTRRTSSAQPDADGKSTGFCGDAAASFAKTIGIGGTIQTNEFVFGNDEALVVFAAPCTGAPFSCLKPGPGPGGTMTLAQLKQGVHAGVDGFTKAVISVSTSGQDVKSVVTGLEVNGVQFLP